MVELDVRTQRRECVTFVAATVTNDEKTPRRVRLRTDLRPVWPPRRQGVPAAGWTDDGVTVTVPADGRRGVGFATPAAPTEPVLAVASDEPVREDAPEPTSDRLVRELGDPTPPADAVPVGGSALDGPREVCEGTNDSSGTAPPVAEPADRRVETSEPVDTATLDGSTDSTVRPPRVVAAWLDVLEEHDSVTRDDRARVAAVAERASALAADLEER